jgi:hypothetical protein
VRLAGGESLGFYYRPHPVDDATLALLRQMDEIYTAYPFMGSRGIQRELKRRGQSVSRHRIRRLMRRMGLQAVAPGPPPADCIQRIGNTPICCGTW